MNERETDSGIEQPKYAAWIAISPDTTDRGRIILEYPGVSEETVKRYLITDTDTSQFMQDLLAAITTEALINTGRRLSREEVSDIKSLMGKFWEADIEEEDIDVDPQRILRTKSEWQILAPGYGGIWVFLADQDREQTISANLDAMGLRHDLFTGRGDLLLDMTVGKLRLSYDTGDKLMAAVYIAEDQMGYIGY